MTVIQRPTDVAVSATRSDPRHAKNTLNTTTTVRLYRITTPRTRSAPTSVPIRLRQTSNGLTPPIQDSASGLIASYITVGKVPCTSSRANRLLHTSPATQPETSKRARKVAKQSVAGKHYFGVFPGRICGKTRTKSSHADCRNYTKTQTHNNRVWSHFGAWCLKPGACLFSTHSGNGFPFVSGANQIRTMPRT